VLDTTMICSNILVKLQHPIRRVFSVARWVGASWTGNFAKFFVEITTNKTAVIKGWVGPDCKIAGP